MLCLKTQLHFSKSKLYPTSYCWNQIKIRRKIRMIGSTYLTQPEFLQNGMIQLSSWFWKQLKICLWTCVNVKFTPTVNRRLSLLCKCSRIHRRWIQSNGFLRGRSHPSMTKSWWNNKLWVVSKCLIQKDMNSLVKNCFTHCWDKRDKLWRSTWLWLWKYWVWMKDHWTWSFLRMGSSGG